jgi:predicted dehydrogenase
MCAHAAGAIKEDNAVMEMTRRQFVQSAAAAGAGLMLSNRLFAQAGGAGSGEIRVGLIGAGTQGRVLLNDCLKIDGVRFTAVCDIWDYSLRYASRRLKAYDQPVNTYKDYRELLAKETDLDAVIVATPDCWHAEHTNAALQAGKHVYCEKEMSNTLESAASMVKAAAGTDKLLQIGHQRRSNPVYQQALSIIRDEGVCGRLTYCYGQWNRGVQPKLTWPERYEIPADELKKYGYDSMEEFRNWRWYRKYSAGPIADLGSHQIDIFSWFLDADPTRVVALGGEDYFPDREWYEDVVALYEYDTEQNGKKGSVRATYQVLNTNSYGHYFERFCGDGGAITLSENPKKCYYVPEPGKQMPEWMGAVEPVAHWGTQCRRCGSHGAVHDQECAPAAPGELLQCRP